MGILWGIFTKFLNLYWWNILSYYNEYQGSNLGKVNRGRPRSGLGQALVSLAEIKKWSAQRSRNTKVLYTLRSYHDRATMAKLTRLWSHNSECQVPIQISIPCSYLVEVKPSPNRKSRCLRWPSFNFQLMWILHVLYHQLFF